MQTSVYQFKIVLKDIDHIHPKIWRRIQVPSQFTMHQLNCAIVDSMNWIGGKLYHYNITKLGRKHSHVGVQLTDYYEERMLCSICVNIEEFFNKPSDKYVHSYDFDRGWTTEVIFQRILPQSEQEMYPRCVAGKGSADTFDPNSFEASDVVFNDEEYHCGELFRPIFFNEMTCRRENHLRLSFCESDSDSYFDSD